MKTLSSVKFGAAKEVSTILYFIQLKRPIKLKAYEGFLEESP